MMIRPVCAAEQKILVEGLADVEVWDTGSRSLLLSRNEGNAATQGRLRLWTAAQLTERLQGLALGRIEGGDSFGYLDTEETQTELEQAWLRYSLSVPWHLVVQAGRMPEPIGNLSNRYLSSRTPLIGNPATYEALYPVGVEVIGSIGRADFVAAVIDQPLLRQEYLPEPSSSLRPAVGVGITPLTGFRIGAYATWGSYLAQEVEPFLPPGRSWRDFQQQVTGLDLQFSRGHFELNGELTRSTFEVPGQHDESGFVYYLEPKYTWSPRWFTALRIERNKATDVWLPYMAGWYVTDEEAWDLETGVGFRIDPRTLIKASYRIDRSTEDPANSPAWDHALAVQLSYGFDARSWFERPR